MKKCVAFLLVVALALAPMSVGAQGIPVMDALNLEQIAAMAEHTLNTLNKLRDEFDLITKMSKGLNSLDRYRIPGVQTSSHDVSRFTFGAPWLQGLNSGDARGQGYFATVHTMQRDVSPFTRMSPEAQKIMQSAYATVEIFDSVAMLGGNQSAIVKNYHGKIGEQIQALEHDVLNRSEGFDQMTAIADKIAVGQNLSRRQDMADNQLISSILEQRLAQSKRVRDDEAMNMNMILNGLKDAQSPNPMGTSIVRGSTSVLRNWRIQ